MKIRRVTLSLLLALAGCLLMGRWLLTGPAVEPYQGYFRKDFSLQRLISRADSSLKIEGSGGGGGGGGHYMVDYTHQLSSERPINNELIDALQDQLLSDLRSAGVTVLRTRNVSGADSNYPASGVRLTTWGFQVLYDDHGWKGTLTLRLMATSIKDLERHGHKGELSENIAVFARS